LLAFVRDYAGEKGRAAGKTDLQRRRARRLILDFELKRVPFRPELVGDDFQGDGPSLMETRLVEEIRRARMVSRCRVRSFDHRAVAAVKRLEPKLVTGLLTSETALVAPGR